MGHIAFGGIRRLARSGGAAALLAVLALTLLPPAPAAAAGPRLIVVEGDLLPAPIELTDWRENLDFLLATETAGRTVSGDDWRPRLDLLYYYLPEGAPLSAAAGAPPQARVPFWPATRDHAAVIGNRVPEPRALEILARHGVPTYIDLASPPSAASERVAATARSIAIASTLVLAACLAVLAARMATPFRP